LLALVWTFAGRVSDRKNNDSEIGWTQGSALILEIATDRDHSVILSTLSWVIGDEHIYRPRGADDGRDNAALAATFAKFFGGDGIRRPRSFSPLPPPLRN